MSRFTAEVCSQAETRLGNPEAIYGTLVRGLSSSSSESRVNSTAHRNLFIPFKDILMTDCDWFAYQDHFRRAKHDLWPDNILIIPRPR